MTVKRDAVVDSIRGLAPGSKVSVRGLAEELGVSVGTAHKAVRTAEELGLVQVVPRSGTFRSAGNGRTEVRRGSFCPA